MKRHGFGGQPASHGNSLTHRAMGSAGQSQGGGSRVLPGKKMAGRMGGHQHTTQNLKVLDVNPELGLVIVSGWSHLSIHLQDGMADSGCRCCSRSQGLHSAAPGRHQEGAPPSGEVKIKTARRSCSHKNVLYQTTSRLNPAIVPSDCAQVGFVL